MVHHVLVSVNDADVGWLFGEAIRKHHIIVYLAGFPFNCDLHNSLDLQKSLLLAIFDELENLSLEVRINMKHLLYSPLDDELRIVVVCAVEKLLS